MMCGKEVTASVRKPGSEATHCPGSWEGSWPEVGHCLRPGGGGVSQVAQEPGGQQGGTRAWQAAGACEEARVPCSGWGRV